MQAYNALFSSVRTKAAVSGFIIGGSICAFAGALIAYMSTPNDDKKDNNNTVVANVVLAGAIAAAIGGGATAGGCYLLCSTQDNQQLAGQQGQNGPNNPGGKNQPAPNMGNCSVCFEENKALIKLPAPCACVANMCLECATDWFAGQGKNTCPTCRAVIVDLTFLNAQ